MRYIIGSVAIVFLSAIGGVIGVYCHQGKEQPKEVPEGAKEFTNMIDMKLALIPAGTFTMGSPKDELHRNTDEIQHEVAISKLFFMGVYEVTQGQYQKIMGVNP